MTVGRSMLLRRLCSDLLCECDGVQTAPPRTAMISCYWSLFRYLGQENPIDAIPANYDFKIYASFVIEVSPCSSLARIVTI